MDGVWLTIAGKKTLGIFPLPCWQRRGGWNWSWFWNGSRRRGSRRMCPLYLPWLLYRGSPPPRWSWLFFRSRRLENLLLLLGDYFLSLPRRRAVSCSLQVGGGGRSARFHNWWCPPVLCRRRRCQAHRVVEGGCQSRWRGRRHLGFRHLNKVVVVFCSRSLFFNCFPLRCGSGKLPSYFQLDSFPSVNRQIGLPTIGILPIARAQTSGTSRVSMSQVKLRLINKDEF